MINSMNTIPVESLYYTTLRGYPENSAELTWQSPAPTRAKMQSRTEMLALTHGTKEPTCAIRTFTPTCKCKLYIDRKSKPYKS